VSAERQFIIGPGPHVHAAETTSRIMWWVNGALAPAALWGAFIFGWPAIRVLLASILGALLAEAAMQRSLGRPTRTVRDGSAFCTGLLLAMTLPPLVAPWMAFVGAAFSIVFGKALFGGLGFNLFNPALIGRAFMLATFPQAMTLGWSPPRIGAAAGLDAVTTATPLAALRESGVDAAMQLVGGPGSPWVGLVLGFRPGSIGEVSVLLVALGGVVLVARGIIGWTIPLAVLAGVVLSTAFSGAPLLHLLSGGLWLGAFFMATDYVTSPGQRGGQIVFGLLIGALTGVIRQFGGYPEGICYAILLGNTLVPALNQWFRPRRTQVATTGAPS